LSIADLGVTSDKIAVGAVQAEAIGFGAVTFKHVSTAGAQTGQIPKFSGTAVEWADDLGLTLPATVEVTTDKDAAFRLLQYGEAPAASFEAYLQVNSYPAVHAQNAGPGGGIVGIDMSSTGSFGVAGITESDQDGSAGVYGYTAGGESFGVFGDSDSPNVNSAGVYGTADFGHGVRGFTESTAANVAGVHGEGPRMGVIAMSTNTSGQTAGVWGYAESDEGAGIWGHSNHGHGVFGRTFGDWNWRSGVYGEASKEHAIGVTGWNTGSGNGVYAWSENGTALVAKGGGSVLLEVYDRVSGARRFRIDSDGDVYADGTFNPNGADFAELYPTAEPLEPGTVVAIGPDGRAVRATVERASAVMGVVATRPSVLGRLSPDLEPSDSYVQVAILGIVDVAVTDGSGSIRPGDLLTVGGVPGTAERAVWATPGTIVGKALEPHDEGEGSIRMLVTLR
jgi:hypothetical protein